MEPTLPVNHGDNLAGFRVNVDDDLFNQCPDDALLQSNVRLLALPGVSQSRQKTKKPIRPRPSRLHETLSMPANAVLELANLFESLIPSALQFVGNQTVLWISAIVLLLCSIGGVASCIQIPIQCVQDFVLFTALFFICEHCRFHCCWLNHTQHLMTDCFIHRSSTKRDAFRFTAVKPAATTGIADHIMVTARVNYRQLAPTTTAAQQSAQYSRAVLGSPRLLEHADVALDLPLDLFELSPADISLMDIGNECQPLILGLPADSLP